MHTPDLDDVFFALTGQPEERPEDQPGDPASPDSQKQTVTQS